MMRKMADDSVLSLANETDWQRSPLTPSTAVITLTPQDYIGEKRKESRINHNQSVWLSL